MKLLTEWAITSSVLILIVLAARFFLKDRLSARLRYALWGVVLLRLLVPFQVELPAAGALPVLASNLAPEVANVELYALRTNSRPLPEESLAEMRESGIDAGAVLGTQAPIYTFGGLEVEGHTTCRVLSDTGIDTYLFYTTLPKFLMTLWAVGAVCAMGVIFRSNRHFLGRLKYYRHALEGVDAPIPVYTAAHLTSPCLFGVFKPAVYVTPGAAESPEALRHVLAHELTHYAHRDHIWSLLRCLALALHWYNPLVWLAVWLSKGDGELACDEGAVARLGEGERVPYGRTLVDMVAQRSPRPADLLSCSTAMMGGRKSIQQRVAQLVKKPETVKAALFALVAVVAVAAVFVFTGRSEVPGERDAFLAQVQAAQGIWFNETMLHNGRVVIDSSQLDQLRELLTLEPLTKEEESWTWDGVWNLTISFASTPPDTDWTGSEECFYYLSMEENGQWYVLLPTERDEHPSSGDFVGRIPEGNWEKIEEIYQNAPSVDDRQHGMDLEMSAELEDFLAEAERASSVQLRLSPLSSANPPDPITDPDLLALVREKLAGFTPVGENWVGPGWRKLLAASRIALSDGEKEAVYALVVGDDSRTYLFSEADYEACQALGESETRKVTALARTDSNVETSLYHYTQMQEGRDGDPNYFVPMTYEEQSGYTPEVLRTMGVTQLQGWGGGMEGVQFYNAATARDYILLRYLGDEAHDGGWVLVLEREDHTVLADQPMCVFTAEWYDLNEEARFYEGLGPDMCAAYLLPEDVISVTAGDYEPGQEISLDVPALKEQLTQALYHQFTAEYDREKYGQYAVTLHLADREEDAYLGHELAEDAHRLILSAGSEEGVVCLRKTSFAASSEPLCTFVRSPELYQTIWNIFD